MAPKAKADPKAKSKGKGKGKAKAKGKAAAPIGGPEPLPAPAPLPAHPARGHNASHYAKVKDWLDMIENCELFHIITHDNPLSVADGGSQAPFNWTTGQLALRDARRVERHYTCGINFFWCDMLYTPAVGVPIRESSVSHLMDHYFRTPSPCPHILSIALLEGEDPEEKKGKWMCLNPEEILHAMLGAIARDIQSGDTERCPGLAQYRPEHHGRAQDLHRPRHQAEQGHAAPGKHGLRRRGHDPLTNATHLRDRGFRNSLRDARGKVSVAEILAYYERLCMRDPVTKCFIDSALTVHSRVLTLPDAERLLLRMDGLPKAKNPFSSLQRLQTIVSKAQTDQQLLVWFLYGIAHMVEHLKVLPDSPDLTMTGLAGRKTASGEPLSHGTLDLLHFKKTAHQHIFGTLAVNLRLDAAGGDWLLQAKQCYRSHEEYYLSKVPARDLWRISMTPAQARFMRFAEELIYTDNLDNSIRALLRASKGATQLDEDTTLAAALQEVQSLQIEATREAEMDAGMEAAVPVDSDEDEDRRKGLVLEIVLKGEDGAEPGSRSLAWKDLTPCCKSAYQRAEGYINQQLDNFVHLLHLDNLDEAMGVLLQTPAGKYEPPMEGNRRKFVGILVDTRVLGEANNRPAIRLPPLDVVSIHKLLSAIRNRHGETYHQTLHEHDLYMTLSGGRDLVKYSSWFNNLDKTKQQVTHRTVFVHMDPESVESRYSRVAGVCSAKSWDMLRLTAQPWPKRTLSTVKRLNYKGKTVHDNLGPVIMPDLDNRHECWTTTWAIKKLVYAGNIIKVGGTDGYTDDNKPQQGDSLEEEPAKEKVTARSDEMEEPLFFHAMPMEFFEELIHDFSLGAIICIGVGDGAAALACLRQRVPFTGFCLTEEHKTRVRVRLEEKCLGPPSIKATPGFTTHGSCKP